MSEPRRTHTAAFKAKVALEAASEAFTIAEIASRYQIHPNQVSTWKARLLADSKNIFEDRRREKPVDEPSKDELYQKIGQLEVEVDWLKKKSVQAGLIRKA